MTFKRFKTFIGMLKNNNKNINYYTNIFDDFLTKEGQKQIALEYVILQIEADMKEAKALTSISHKFLNGIAKRNKSNSIYI